MSGDPQGPGAPPGGHRQEPDAPQDGDPQGPDAPQGGERQGVPRRGGRVVISSVTGEPIPWEEQAPSRRPRAAEHRPILPDRVEEDAPEAGADETNDARIARDVPPHWGRGR